MESPPLPTETAVSLILDQWREDLDSLTMEMMKMTLESLASQRDTVWLGLGPTEELLEHSPPHPFQP